MTLEEAWQELLEKDDRTSGAEYPDMCLITQDELRDFMDLPKQKPADDGAIVFWYRNYKGEEGYRRAIPISIRYGTSEWHKEQQWLWLMDDTENNKRREFAVRDMSGVLGSPVINTHG